MAQPEQNVRVRLDGLTDHQLLLLLAERLLPHIERIEKIMADFTQAEQDLAAGVTAIATALTTEIGVANAALAASTQAASDLAAAVAADNIDKQAVADLTTQLQAANDAGTAAIANIETQATALNTAAAQVTTVAPAAPATTS